MPTPAHIENGRKTFLQGHFDRLCSLYAVIHAIEHSANISGTGMFHRKTLFNLMVHKLEKEGLLAKAVTYGVEIDDLSDLLSFGTHWAQRHIGTNFSITRPFKGNFRQHDDRLMSVLNEHFSQTNTTAIVLIQGNLDHWTCIKSIEGSKLRLSDSYGLHHFSGSTFSTRRQHAANPRYPVPDSLHLVRATEKG